MSNCHFNNIVHTHNLLIIQLQNEYRNLKKKRGKPSTDETECEIPKLKFNRKNSSCLDSQRASEIVCLSTV